MRRIVRLAVVVSILVLPRVAPAQNVLFYNGDKPLGLSTVQSNFVLEAHGIYYLTYDNFVVSDGGWSVTGLFGTFGAEVISNRMYWEIRTGMAAGEGGSILFSGFNDAVSDVLHVTTFPLSDGSTVPYTLWTGFVDLSPLSFYLAPGTYWMSLAPSYVGSDFFNATVAATVGANAVNPLHDQTGLSHSEYFGRNYVENVLGPNDFSYGLVGSTVPEPATMTLLATGLLGLASARRRRNG